MTDNRKTAIWIEDQPQSFPLIRSLLDKAFQRVAVATSAVDAELLLSKEQFALIVADVLLPRGGERMQGSPYLGLESLKFAAPETRTVIVTLLSESEVARAAAVVEMRQRYTYFSKLELGPRLAAFRAALVVEDEHAHA